ncbi:hypothetical protein PVT71_12220 [Salipiger sp. H15]|uniref:Calcium-binding protein n=1 Tax=Alloyangia sp. H15 TaxID=3029062 RepID=A0AAU8AFK1_9RHOB
MATNPSAIPLAPVPAPIAPGLTEAETLDILAGYQVKGNPHASGGAYLEATPGSYSSRASGVFTGAHSFYDVTLGYMDELDGNSRMNIYINGAFIQGFSWNSQAGTDTVSRATKAEHLLPDLLLSPGDVIDLNGSQSDGEPLRTDYLRITDAMTPLTGTAQGETLRGTAGADRITALGGADHVLAGGGPDVIDAGEGQDTVRAGDGDDTITGGPGTDYIYTGAGHDTVVLSDAESFDKLYDFEVGVDTLELAIPGVGPGDLWLDRWRLMAMVDGEARKIAYIPSADSAGVTIKELLQPEVPDDATTLYSLHFGEELHGSLEVYEDIDWFRFELQAGTFYVFTLVGDPESVSPVLRPALGLHDATGRPLGGSNDSGAPVGQLPYLATSDAEAFVSVYDLYGGDGDYILSALTADMLDTVPGDASTDVELAVGADVHGNLGYPGDTDWIRAELHAGQLYDFVLVGDPESDAPASDPEFSLYDASGELIGVRYYWSWPDFFYTPEADELVFVQVSANFGHEAGTGVGDYLLQLLTGDEAADEAGDEMGAAPADSGTLAGLAVDETPVSDIGLLHDPSRQDTFVFA